MSMSSSASTPSSRSTERVQSMSRETFQWSRLAFSYSRGSCGWCTGYSCWKTVSNLVGMACTVLAVAGVMACPYSIVSELVRLGRHQDRTGDTPCQVGEDGG